MEIITTSDELRLFNRGRILSGLRAGGSQSRTFLAESTGLSPSTVTQVTADLIDDGIIRLVAPTRVASENPSSTARRGRPQVLLQLNPDAATTAVVTLLLNELEVTLYDYSGKQLQSILKRIVTAKLSMAMLKKHLFNILNEILDSDARKVSLQHIAVVCQGTVARDNNGLLWSPITKLTHVDFRSILQQRFDVSVSVANDCNMMARAIHQERQCLSSKASAVPPLTHHSTQTGKLNTNASDNFAVILSSYGMGLGYFHQGDILTGSHSSGTEFGHMLFQAGGARCRCGRDGCIEAYASDYAIWRRANNKSPGEQPADVVPADEFKQLIALAQQQPGPAREAFEEAGIAIGQGLSNLFAIFDPFPVILVGISPDAYRLMEAALRVTLPHYSAEENDRTISVYDRATERTLILNGASNQSLSYIDEQIFGFGGSTKTSETRAS